MDTEKLLEALKKVPFPRLPDREQQRAARKEYLHEVEKLEQQWAKWLHKEFAPFLRPAAAQFVYEYVRENHSLGYQEMQNWYEEVATLIHKVNTAENKN